MIEELKSLRLNDSLISDIRKRFRDNEIIAELCYVISSKIESSSKTLN